MITAAIKINTDLERMGDLAVNIAKRALSLMDEPMANMVRKSLNAFVSKDAALAQSDTIVRRCGGRVAERVFHELISFMQREPNHIPQAMNLLSIVRRPERVADHATKHRRRSVVLRKRDRRAAPRRGRCEGLSHPASNPKSPAQRMAFDDCRRYSQPT